MGFTINIGVCSIFLNELLGMLLGLKIAWNNSMQKLLLEYDNLAMVMAIQGNFTNGIEASSLIREIRRMLLYDWEVHIAHVYQEANHIADWLANRDVSLPLGVQLFYSLLDKLTFIPH